MPLLNSFLVTRFHSTTKNPGRRREPDTANVTEYDTITNILIHESFCILLLISLHFYKKIVIIHSVNIFILLMHALEFYVLSLKPIFGLFYSPLYKGARSYKLHFPDSFTCWAEAILSSPPLLPPSADMGAN